ncbi:hypothetical protein DFS34DRAFT_460039 [Phlyctochytrium arcticum]|nr:hypothetical protein DFS34DRAFT_460039 [Phlyctochytrium arcticum]
MQFTRFISIIFVIGLLACLASADAGQGKKRQALKFRNEKLRKSLNAAAHGRRQAEASDVVAEPQIIREPFPGFAPNSNFRDGQTIQIDQAALESASASQSNGESVNE